MKTNSILATLFALSACALAACGDDEGSGSTNSSSSSTGGSAADCSMYLNETRLGELDVTIKNNRAASIYVGGGVCSPRFTVTAPDLMITRADLESDAITCEEAQKSSDYALDCLDGTVIEIAPGSTQTLTWYGLLWEPVEMPESCFGPSSTGMSPLPTCLQGRAPKAGTLELGVTLYEEATCQDSTCRNPASGFEVTKSFEYPGDAATQIDVN